MRKYWAKNFDVYCGTLEEALEKKAYYENNRCHVKVDIGTNNGMNFIKLSMTKLGD